MAAKVDKKICDQCGTCVSVCKPGAIQYHTEIEISEDLCTSCAHCVRICPFGALVLEKSKA